MPEGVTPVAAAAPAMADTPAAAVGTPELPIVEPQTAAADAAAPATPTPTAPVTDAAAPAATPAQAPPTAAGTVETSASGAPAPKPAYPPPAPTPTQAGPKDARFDFNEGCRVALPDSDHPWRVRISDLDTGNILYETEIKAG